MWRSILALLGTVAFAQSVPVPKLAIEHYQLPNGMQVVLCPDKKFPLVHFDLRVYAGSKHERPGRSGLAHLVEHLMFEAVEGAGTFNDAVERIGGSGVNAETHQDFTAYYDDCAFDAVGAATLAGIKPIRADAGDRDAGEA